MNKDMLPGMGRTLKGRFGGRLLLYGGYVDECVTNMLLEIPSRLHFTEAGIQGTHECFLSTVRLAEACGRTLLKLSYSANRQGKSYPFPWPSWF